ncbi:energy-coupling factor transport system ATP-binding protein [Enterococcus sp. DIV2402]|uniref:Energy-coupling factor transport system ATP-binding protein n=1 Tax=Candidatus Enterococcus lowellii TaxID=2230877 RepID=A0ABZ2SQY8_9ENTE|nr:ABC transporter ATP-binding protein [Enterococcus sp. DIV2402]MBO0463814.1 ABC transporter ATP-binding protein [Enterococcus sp. DIV2402]
MDIAVQLQNVSYSYDGENNQLKNIDLRISKGECVLLTGGSGCGKTTITRLINGLIPHYFEGNIQGEIYIDGMHTSLFESWEYGEHVGSVFQDARSQFFTSHILDELAFTSENYGYDPETIKNRIDHVTKANRIVDLKNRKLENLSSGEKQKVAMSVVQVSDPDIYVLDEPSANLDFESCLILAKLLKKLKKQGKTILIADHRIYYLMNLFDRVVYMEEGTIKNQGDSERFNRLDDEYLNSLGIRSNQAITLNEIMKKQPKLESRRQKESELHLNNLSVGYGRRNKPLLENIEFTMSKGEIVVLTGKNGIGKTTLAQTLCGLLKEKAGTIMLNKTKLSMRERRKKFWFVLQDADYQLFSDSVVNELLLGINRTTENIERAEKIMQDLGLETLKERHPASLSGGQKQRLTFAVGLMRQPDYLILDEPTSGLDARNMQRMHRLIDEYREKGIRFIIISHDFEFVSKMQCLIIDMNEYC